MQANNKILIELEQSNQPRNAMKAAVTQPNGSHFCSPQSVHAKPQKRLFPEILTSR
jgi:hypothetical protein